MSKRQVIELPKNTIDETGHRYGSLLVMEYREQASAVDGSAMWRCKCDCGNETVVRGKRLRSGHIVSCGCWRANPAVRQAARLKTPAKRRREIAKMGAEARKKGAK